MYHGYCVPDDDAFNGIAKRRRFFEWLTDITDTAAVGISSV